MKRPIDETLLRAMTSFDIPAMRDALEKGADANVRMDGVGRTPLMHLAGLSWYDRISATNLLLEFGADATLTDQNGRTALHVVAESSVWKSEEIVRTLLKAGADIEAADKFGHRPLHLAVRQWLQEEQPFVLLELLESGADVHAKNKAGHTAPDIAIASRQMPEGKEKMRNMFNRYAVKQAAREKTAREQAAAARAKLRAQGKKPGLKLKK